MGCLLSRNPQLGTGLPPFRPVGPDATPLGPALSHEVGELVAEGAVDLGLGGVDAAEGGIDIDPVFEKPGPSGSGAHPGIPTDDGATRELDFTDASEEVAGDLGEVAVGVGHGRGTGGGG